MIKHKFSNRVVSGNLQVINGEMDSTEDNARPRGAETLEDECIRRWPDDWERLSEELSDFLIKKG